MFPVSDIYQSRSGHEAAIVSRDDPVVYPGYAPEDGAGFTQHELKRYEKNGFLLLKSFFSPEEVAVFMREAARFVADPAIRSREEAVIEPGGSDVRSVFMVHRLNALFQRLACDARLVHKVRQILGGDVYIHQSRLNLKPGFAGKEFYWHSDFETWHVEDGMPRMRALSCTILLDENNEFNGPLMIIPGSHKQYISCVGRTPEDHYKQSLRKQEYGVPDALSLRLLADQGGIQSMKGPAGSVVLFDCNAMHGSSSNISPHPRSNLFVVYNSVDNALAAPQCGLKPRPEFIATRADTSPIPALAPEYAAG